MLDPRLTVPVVCLVVVLCAACGSRGSEAEPQGVPAHVEASEYRIELPQLRLRRFAVVEDLAARSADWLGGLSKRLLLRDFDGAGEWLASDFKGHDLFGARRRAVRARPLGARIARLEAESVVDARGFLAALRTRLGPWRRVRAAHIGVREAEFARDRAWGRLLVKLDLLGVTADGGREAIRAALHVSVRMGAGSESWTIDGLEVLSATSEASPAPLFVDVSRASGVAFEGVRYGTPGNDAEGWNGAAAADIDGDGWIDVFVPSATRSFLYRNAGDGTFREEADERGLAADVAGTGAVFVDYDRDGDEDLFVAHVGWIETQGTRAGDRLRLYANDGRGHFDDVTAAVGLDVFAPIWSLTAFDHDGDGWVDLFACGYGRMQVERNDSWIEATNGARNWLLRNADGKSFTDVTVAVGLEGARWSHAAAAADFDRDGDQDLYVANNFGSNRLWRNDGSGHFEDVAAELGVAERGNSMAAVWADWNGDGRLDLFTTGPTSHTGERVLARLAHSRSAKILQDVTRMASGNALFLSEDGGFRRMRASGAEDAGWAWSAVVGDFDLDGALDLFCANGFVTGDLPRDT
ncbi:MAG: VCBS repeat-containing protein [bacterium]|nr:VCBS repeat-containing protein [bacterium]